MLSIVALLKALAEGYFLKSFPHTLMVVSSSVLAERIIETNVWERFFHPSAASLMSPLSLYNSSSCFKASV